MLALPIAVIGMHFDDEWGRNRKEQHFESSSRVALYNSVSFYGTRPGDYYLIAMWWMCGCYVIAMRWLRGGYAIAMSPLQLRLLLRNTAR